MSLPISPRAIHLPNPGAYVRIWRQLKTLALDRPDVSGWLWGSYNDVRGHLRSFSRALEARINQRGQLRMLIDQDREAALRRDQRRLHDYLQRRIVHSGSGFETELCRRRFPMVHARMRERCDD